MGGNDNLNRSKTMDFKFNDGGRKEAGFDGTTGDCVVRSIAIAMNIPYKEVYDDMNLFIKSLRQGRHIKSSSSRTGIAKTVSRRYITERLGWVWVPTMTIGSGCKVHLKADELPKGRIICKVSKHLVAVIDGEIQDTHDCTRNGTRCVYGYYFNKWTQMSKIPEK